jgi:acyl carrier protein
MVPSYFIQIEKIPLTANGKIDRKSLPDPRITFGNEYIAPRNEIEEQLVVIWSEILGIEREKIGINFNFFDLGGHSLKAVILISKIKEVLNVNIPISNIFKEPTIENLSILINFAKNREESNINKEDRKKVVL